MSVCRTLWRLNDLAQTATKAIDSKTSCLKFSERSIELCCNMKRTLGMKRMGKVPRSVKEQSRWLGLKAIDAKRNQISRYMDVGCKRLPHTCYKDNGINRRRDDSQLG